MPHRAARGTLRSTAARTIGSRRIRDALVNMGFAVVVLSAFFARLLFGRGVTEIASARGWWGEVKDGAVPSSHSVSIILSAHFHFWCHRPECRPSSSRRRSRPTRRPTTVPCVYSSCAQHVQLLSLAPRFLDCFQGLLYTGHKIYRLYKSSVAYGVVDEGSLCFKKRRKATDRSNKNK